MYDKFRHLIVIPLWLKVIFSALCLISIIIHALFSDVFVIDLTTASLLLLFLIPWLLDYIDVIRMPGGPEIQFKKEIDDKLKDLTKKEENKEVLKPPKLETPLEYYEFTPIYEVIDGLLNINPNSAIIIMRGELERKIRKLALASKIQTQNKSLSNILKELNKEKRLRKSDWDFLNDIIKLGDMFITKGITTEPSSALQILRVGKNAIHWLYAHTSLIKQIDFRFDDETWAESGH